MLQQQIVTFPTHSKTQRQVSPGTHVAVLALRGLQEPPTTHGVPLSSMAKSSPLSVLDKSAHICICVTRMGPLPAQAPFRIFTLSKWHLTCLPWTSLNKDPQNPHRCRAHPCIPELQKPNCQGLPLLLPKLLIQVDKLHPSIWLICREPSRTGGP